MTLPISERQTNGLGETRTVLLDILLIRHSVNLVRNKREYRFTPHEQ